MITRLEIEGFKSFGSPSQAVDLSPLTFIVGQNASGKSNFLSALRFLHDSIRQDAEYACNDQGGLAAVRNKLQRQRKEDKPLRLRVRLDDRIPFAPSAAQPATARSGGNQPQSVVSDFDYSLSIDLRSSSETPIIVEERLHAKILKDQQTLEYQLVRDNSFVRIDDPFANGSGSAENTRVPEQEQSRPAVAVFFSYPAVLFRHIVLDWSFFNISPRVARESYREMPDASLGTAGENLAVILHKLQARNGKNALSGIVNNLRGAVPGFQSVDAKKTALESRWTLQVTEEKIRGAINPSSVSDGTIRLLALMVIAHLGEEGAHLIAVEEPENGVHPHLCEHLISVFRHTSKRSQVLATTHNPAFLDCLNPDEVLLCGKVDGLTRIRRADALEELDAFRQHFNLGELWVQGTFDGMLDS